MDATAPQFTGFTPDILSTLHVRGVAERWAAVQDRLHPALVGLAEALHAQGTRRFPREWPLYEVSFRSLRYLNRPGGRAPIDDYHMGLDRPPRGAGIYVVVSGVERLIVVALQLASRQRKADLARVWEEGRTLWLPLVVRLDEVRFADRRRPTGDDRPATTDDRRPTTARQADKQTGRQGDTDDITRDGQRTTDNGQRTTDNFHPLTETWMDRYLASRGAAYLLAGFAYSWDDERIGQPEFAAQVVEDALALFPLNEAIMEQAEALDPYAASLLRERRASYPQFALPAAETIVERIHARGFALSDALIRAYHVALRTKPLVILPGISGTGKTRLTRLYADAIYADTLAPGLENEHYLLVAVQPDWHNARDLLGYYNALTGKFHPTPFLRFLLRAAADPAALYFICLDEMNLARPEYYLAPILSALETEDHLIDLGVPGPTIESVTGETLQNPFRLPLNVRLTGTVNVDESTHTLSDKLLDRANVIELTDIDLEAFRRSYTGAVDEAAWQAITRIQAIVARAAQPFGYRTVAEMLRYIEQARGVIPSEQALDQQIKQKILPKLRGDDTPRLRRALTELLELVLGKPRDAWGKAGAVAPEDVAAAPFPESAEKVRRMLERLDVEGFTDFYG